MVCTGTVLYCTAPEVPPDCPAGPTPSIHTTTREIFTIEWLRSFREHKGTFRQEPISVVWPIPSPVPTFQNFNLI